MVVGILVKPGRPKKNHQNTVHYLDVVYQYQLPQEESHSAWLARFGLWKPAPYHDELWDGDLMAFRARPLTKAELAKENKQYWLRQHFPLSIFVYSWIGRKRSKKTLEVGGKSIEEINQDFLEQEARRETIGVDVKNDTEVVTKEPESAVGSVAPKIKIRDSHKRVSKNRREEELNREIDRMISDEPKKPNFVNKGLVERKTMLVKEYLRENGKNSTAEDVERELQRRLAGTRPELVLAGKKGKETRLREEDDSFDEDEEKVEDKDEDGEVRRSPLVSRGSGFGWEMLDRLYGILGQEDNGELTDEERDAEDVERFDAVQQELNRIDGVQGTAVPRSDFYEQAREQLMQMYESLQAAIRSLLKLDD